jgi:hypothetical protein
VREETVSEAWPVESSETVARTVAPSVKVMVPEIGAKGKPAATVAVKVMALPTREGLVEELSVVLVETMLMDSESDDDVEALKLASPE